MTKMKQTTKELQITIKVAIVDGMAELQSLKKPDSIKDYLQLAELFCDRIFTKYADYSEIRLILIVMMFQCP